MVNKRVIIVEFREPKTKAEKKQRGHAITVGDKTDLFINIKQSNHEMLETVFHELSHVVFHWTKHNITDDEQERVAKLVGEIASACYRKFED